MDAPKMQRENIDPERNYPLGYLVRNGMFGTVRQFSTARKHVLEDLLSTTPILKATIVGSGTHRSITIKGENLLKYLHERGITVVA